MRDLGFYQLPNNAAETSYLVPYYRSSDIYPFCQELNARISMLNPDVLALLNHFGRYVEGPFLEIGPYIGGSTVALGKGIIAGGLRSRIVSIEMGGAHTTHPSAVHSSDDIVKDLRKNLEHYCVADLIEVVEGNSREQRVFSKVEKLVGEQRFGFLMIDADGHVEQDFVLYRPLLRAGAYLMVDDFYAPGAQDKETTTRAELNALVREGAVQSLGVYGWGTWLGRLN